jgi:hypothetical protein
MRKLVKIIINNLMRLIQKRPDCVISFDAQNIKTFQNDNSNEIQFYIINEKNEFKIPPASCLPEDKIQHFGNFESIVECLILEIKNRNYQFNRNFLLTPQKNVIYQKDISLYALPISTKYFKKAKYINGSIAYLSNSNVNNYAHWFQFTLPLLYFYWKSIKKEMIDYYYVGDIEIKKFQLDSLAQLGIKKEQIINYPCNSDCVYMAIKENPIQLGFAKFNDLSSINFNQSIFADKNSLLNLKSPKKIFIERGNVTYRKLLKSDQLITFLKNEGYYFCALDKLTFKEQAILFYNADNIIAPHGAALTNIMFCKPDTKLLELFPYKYQDWTFYTLSAYGKLNYFYMVGEKVNPEENPATYNDIFIDFKKFKTLYTYF